MKRFPVALQLFSVGRDMVDDFEGTLKRIAEMGYQGVETAGLYDHTPEEMMALCKKYGLVHISAHVSYRLLKEDAEKWIGQYADMGCKYVVIPNYHWRFGEETESYEDFLQTVRRAGEIAKANGMTLLYHNHDYEFKMMDGQYRLDRLYSDVSDDLLQTELDVCWVKVGGEDPAAYIRKYAGRTPVVHLKDYIGKKYNTEDEPRQDDEKQPFEFRPVGYGVQDFPAILEAATESGAEWVVVEQDGPGPSMNIPPMECAAKSREYLKSIGL